MSRFGSANDGPMPDPIAYFLTWATYGTWLPGDDRGWVQYHKGWYPPDPVRKERAEQSLTEDPCVLDHEQRHLAEQTIQEHCRIRGWTLHAVNCRSTHLHVVVTADRHPDDVRDQFKAWCTRRLNELQKARRSAAEGGEASRPAVRRKWWAERGSKQFINDEDGLEAAILYVRDGQDHKP